MEANFNNDHVLTTILPFIEGKTVLDIGCVGNKERIWVHGFLQAKAKTVIGIDIAKKEIEILKKHGYKGYYQNAESFRFNRQFDVIFAGELVEHLANPGLFLKQCQIHLKKNGLLIITTPNTFSSRRLLEILFRRSNDPGVSREHTTWYSPKAISQLLARYKFSVQQIFFVNYPFLKPQIKEQLTRLVCFLIGSHFRETMIVVAQH